jgi:hypothetical protein
MPYNAPHHSCKFCGDAHTGTCPAERMAEQRERERELANAQAERQAAAIAGAAVSTFLRPKGS